MDSERWQRIETLFDAALDLDPSRWDTFLDDHCREDPALRTEVAALLASHVPPGEPAPALAPHGRFAKIARFRGPIAAGVVLMAIAALVLALRSNVSRKDAALDRVRTLEAEGVATRRQSYEHAVAAAEASIRTHQFDDARVLLEATPQELRGWEWKHLARRLDRSLYTVAAHRREITRIAFARDASYFVTSSLDRTVALWSPEDGDSLRRFGPFPAGVVSVAVHPADTTIAAGLADGTVLLLRAADGAERARLTGKGRAMVAFHPDGSRLACAFADGSVTEWRLDTLKPTGTIATRGASPHVAYSRDGRSLVTGDVAGHVKFWDARTRRRTGDVAAHERPVTGMAAGDGNLIATASADGAVKVWNASDRRLVATLRNHAGGVASVAFVPGAAAVVSAGSDRRIVRSRVESGAVVTELYAPGDASAVACDPVGGRIVAGGTDGGLRAWPQSAQDVPVFRAPADSTGRARVSHARLSNDGTMLACAPNGLEICLWDTETGELFARMATARADLPTRVAWSPSGSHVYLGDRGGNVIVFDPVRKRRLLAFAAHSAAIAGLDVSPDGAVLVSAAADSTLKFWDARTLAPRGEARGLSGAVTRVVFAPGGTFATACTDRAIHFWNATTGDTLRTLRGHDAAVIDVAYSPDGARLLSVTQNGGVRLWEAVSGTLLGATETAAAAVACFAPDGTRIMTGGANPAIRVLAVPSLHEVARLHGHTGGIVSLDFTAPRNAIVSASADGTIRLWDAE